MPFQLLEGGRLTAEDTAEDEALLFEEDRAGEPEVQEMAQQVGRRRVAQRLLRILKAEALEAGDLQVGQAEQMEALGCGLEPAVDLVGQKDEERNVRVMLEKRARQDPREGQVALGDDGAGGDATHEKRFLEPEDG